jgi:hypothetical protein
LYTFLTQKMTPFFYNLININFLDNIWISSHRLRYPKLHVDKICCNAHNPRKQRQPTHRATESSKPHIFLAWMSRIAPSHRIG